MSEQLLQSSMEDYVARRAIPPEMLRDLHAIAGLSQETCRRIVDALRGLKGLNTSDAIENAVKGCLGDEDAAKAESVVSALRSLKPQVIPPLVESITAWVSASEPRKELFSDSALERLAENLRVLITDYHAVELMKKADQLLRDVGNELQDVKFVCDLRPVFDKPRTNVEGFVLVANMRLIYVSQEGNRHTCEIALTEEELIQLRDGADRALSKLKVLNEVRSTLAVGSCQKEDAE